MTTAAVLCLKRTRKPSLCPALVLVPQALLICQLSFFQKLGQEALIYPALFRFLNLAYYLYWDLAVNAVGLPLLNVKLRGVS